MFKKILILLLSMNLSAFGNDQQQSMSSTTKIIYGVGGAVVVVGEVLTAPLILPAGTIVVIKTTVATAATQIIAYIANLSLATKIGLGISGARIARPYVIQTTEEKLIQFNKVEAAELHEVKTNFTTCFMKHKYDIQRDSSGCPTACEDIAFTFAILAGQGEFDRVIKSIQ